MRVLIVSDTHGRHRGIEQAIELEKPFDMLIHLGDGEGYEDYIAELCGCPMEIVAGNNDFFSDLDREKIIEIEGLRIFLTHGHYYYVNSGLGDLVYAARKNHCDIVMFGHIHIPLIEKIKGITVLNPGSLTYPRQENKKPSYIVMETWENRSPNYFIKYLDF